MSVNLEPINRAYDGLITRITYEFFERILVQPGKEDELLQQFRENIAKAQRVRDSMKAAMADGP